MSQQHKRWLWGMWAAALAVLLAGESNRLAAQDLGALDNSLKLIPADAATYNTMLRNKEQIDALLKSNAWAKLTALPLVKMGWQKVEEEWNQGNLRVVKDWYEQPENTQLVTVLKDLVSDEIFFTSGPDSLTFFSLLMEVNSANQLAPLWALMRGDPLAAGRPEARIKAVLQALADNLDKVKVPDTVIGFRTSNPQAAKAQLKRLEDFLNIFAVLIPQLKDRVKKSQVAGGEFLTIQLDGDMVPWEQISLQDYEDKPGQYDNLVKKVKSLKMTISLGLRDRYLLFAVGDSTAPLEKLGKGPRLIDRPEFKPLAKHADKKLVSITYLSQETRRSVSGLGNPDELANWADDLLKDSGLPAQQQTRIQKDVKALAADLKRFLPVPGAQMGFSFLSSRGIEGYQYDWSTNHGLDASKPLSLLNHVGGNPMLFAISRTKTSPEDYPILVKWLKTGYQYFEDFGLPNFPMEERQVYDQIWKLALPLLQRLDKTTGKMLLPALADGQGGFILDAKLASRQWHREMPPAQKDLPIFEPAIVLGVSDAELLRQAMKEYQTILNEALGIVAKFAPGVELKVPDPDTKKTDAGTLYSYAIPDIVGLDPKLAPTAGLSQKVLALTVSNDHAARLLKSTPLKISGGPLGDPSRPLAVAVYFEWASLIDALGPWVDYALDLSGPLLAAAPEGLPDQIRTVLQVLRCFNSYASATYLEGDAVVTHSEAIFRDLQK